MAASPARVCVCGCSDATGIGTHRIMAALADDDLDAAMTAGLLDHAACDSCRPQCRHALVTARDIRLTALAARARFRAREARLARRQQEHALRRGAVAASSGASATSLPPAAAAALARARARAARSTRK